MRGPYSTACALPRYAAVVAFLLVTRIGAPALAQQPTPVCGGEEIARGVVRHVDDARTFTLDDGREVRLAGIEVPLPPLPKEANQEADPPPPAVPQPGRRWKL
jgi:hypothetical protein